MSSRRAITLISPPLLGQFAQVIIDHGLAIERSLDVQDYWFGPTVALVISGDQLPNVCEVGQPLSVVNIQVTAKTYGSQRLIRISDIIVDTFATENFERARRSRHIAA
jgi:hypothetical protein